MVQKRIRRTDQEWLDLIQECRTSGLTDKAWCEQQHIQRSNFYYQIRRLRKKACEIPDNPVSSCQEHHEVVAIDFSIPESFPEKNVTDDDRMYWWDASDEVVLSEDTVRWLEGLADRHRKLMEELPV